MNQSVAARMSSVRASSCSSEALALRRGARARLLREFEGRFRGSLVHTWRICPACRVHRTLAVLSKATIRRASLRHLGPADDRGASPGVSGICQGDDVRSGRGARSAASDSADRRLDLRNGMAGVVDQPAAEWEEPLGRRPRPMCPMPLRAPERSHRPDRRCRPAMISRPARNPPRAVLPPHSGADVLDREPASA